MAKKKRKKKPRKPVRVKKISRRRRAYEAALRQIAKEDGITIKKARKKYKQAIVEVMFVRPGKRVDRDFLEVSPGKYLEVEPGKPAKFEYTFGTVRTVGYVSKVRALTRYWSAVRLMAEELNISIKESRRRFTKRKKGGETTDQIIYKFFKVEIKTWHQTEKSLRKKFLGRQN